MSDFMLFWALSILFTAVVLQAVAAMSSGLEIDNWGTALLAALILHLAGWIVAPLLAFIPEAALTGPWQSALLALVFDAVLLLVASMLLDGLRFRGAGTFLLVVVLFVTMDVAMPLVNSVLLTEMK